MLVESAAVDTINLAQERKRLLMAMFRFNAAVTCPVAISRAASRVMVPCRVVVAGATFDLAWLHWQDPHAAVPRPDSGVLIDADHDRVRGEWRRACRGRAADVGVLPNHLGVGGEPERLRHPLLGPIGPPRSCDRGSRSQMCAEQPGRSHREKLGVTHWSSHRRSGTPAHDPTGEGAKMK